MVAHSQPAAGQPPTARTGQLLSSSVVRLYEPSVNVCFRTLIHRCTGTHKIAAQAAQWSQCHTLSTLKVPDRALNSPKITLSWRREMEGEIQTTWLCLFRRVIRGGSKGRGLRITTRHVSDSDALHDTSGLALRLRAPRERAARALKTSPFSNKRSYLDARRQDCNRAL